MAPSFVRLIFFKVQVEYGEWRDMVTIRKEKNGYAVYEDGMMRAGWYSSPKEAKIENPELFQF